MSKFFGPAEETTIARPPSSYLIHSTFGSRKTTVVATYSKYFPLLPAQLPFPTQVNLKDMFYLKWDRDALLGFPKLGLSAPSLDLSRIRPLDVIDAFADIHQEVAERVAKGEVRAIVHDTWGAMDMKVMTYCSLTFDKPTAKDAGTKSDDSRKNSTQVLYRASLAIQQQEFEFYTTLKQPNGDPVANFFLCHTKFATQAPTTDEKQKRVSQGQNQAKGIDLSEGGQNIARITGQAWEFMHQQCALVMYLETRNVNGKNESWLYPTGGQNSVSRDRGGVLEVKEPADFRIILPKYTNWKGKVG